VTHALLDAPIDEAVRAHDASIARLGVSIWVGGEPTFTDRFSLDPQWTSAALGADKEARARELVRLLGQAAPGALLLRTLGRQYAGEASARWSYGIYARRDGRAVWASGLPRDPLAGGDHDVSADTNARALRDELAARLRAYGFACDTGDLPVDLPYRLAFASDRASLDQVSLDARLARASVHEVPVPEGGAEDTLAQLGVRLVAIGIASVEDGVRAVRIELPAFADVAAFVAIVALVGEAARACAIRALVWTGFAPPVDATIAHTTVTPDPAVVEVNAAPSPDLSGYLLQQRAIHACAERVGLAPFRARFDGALTDSGGGGHVTFGGPSPSESPFVRAPHLLPGLVRYAQRHPSLSYLFAVDSLGSSSQSPRADEGLPEIVSEFALALEVLAQRPATSAHALWAALAPFLADHAGNAHRAEINIEKLGNPWLPARGALGLVEMRALRMARTPEHAAAVAALFRAVCGRLVAEPYTAPLIAWSTALHDRMALPFFLHVDLDAVLADLAAAGLGLAAPLRARLHDDGHRRVGSTELDGVQLVVRRAVEHWPLVGDAASQERSNARWVDGSTVRLELVVRSLDGAPLDGVTLGACGVRVPMVSARDAAGDALVAGLRYRAFIPQPGLHPALDACDPVELVWSHAHAAAPQRVSLHAWAPRGGAYEGLPLNVDEAARRREQRMVVEGAQPASLSLRDAPPGARTETTVDLRWMLAVAIE